MTLSLSSSSPSSEGVSFVFETWVGGGEHGKYDVLAVLCTGGVLGGVLGGVSGSEDLKFGFCSSSCKVGSFGSC